jgi:hypothetical protein
MPLQEHSSDRRHDQSHNGGRGGKQDGVDKRRTVTRLGQDREISRDSLRAFRAGHDKPCHRQQKERHRHHRKRQQAEPDKGPM